MNLKQILGLCEHKWSSIDKSDIYDDYGDFWGVKYHLKCDKCGTIKSKLV